MLIDSHAHITYEDKLDTKSIIANMKEDGLYAIVNIGTDLKSSREAVLLAEKNPNVYAIIGMHPDSVDEFSSEIIQEFKQLLNSRKVVAIGEIGLDYHFVPESKEKQKKMFKEFLQLAADEGLPVCIHSREAADDMFEILTEFSSKLQRKGVLHCYSDGAKYAKKYTDLGFYISFAGNVTYKKYDAEFIHELPHDKIIVETDCPFLSPVPLRGSVNQPKNVRYTSNFIADLLGIDHEKFEEITLENTKRVYFKIK